MAKTLDEFRYGTYFRVILKPWQSSRQIAESIILVHKPVAHVLIACERNHSTIVANLHSPIILASDIQRANAPRRRILTIACKIDVSPAAGLLKTVKPKRLCPTWPRRLGIDVCVDFAAASSGVLFVPTRNLRRLTQIEQNPDRRIKMFNRLARRSVLTWLARRD